MSNNNVTTPATFILTLNKVLNKRLWPQSSGAFRTIDEQCYIYQGRYNFIISLLNATKTEVEEINRAAT